MHKGPINQDLLLKKLKQASKEGEVLEKELHKQADKIKISSKFKQSIDKFSPIMDQAEIGNSQQAQHLINTTLSPTEQTLLRDYTLKRQTDLAELRGKITVKQGEIDNLKKQLLDNNKLLMRENIELTSQYNKLTKGNENYVNNQINDIASKVGKLKVGGNK